MAGRVTGVTVKPSLRRWSIGRESRSVERRRHIGGKFLNRRIAVRFCGIENPFRRPLQSVAMAQNPRRKHGLQFRIVDKLSNNTFALLSILFAHAYSIPKTRLNRK